MARTSLTSDQLFRLDRGNVREDVRAKLAEHDTAIDALEGGTTSSVVTIHPARGASTGNVANLAAFTVANDDITFVETDRAFLKDQSTATQNGIYVVGAVAGGTAPLTRAADFNEATEVKPNTLVAVSAGTLGANTLWQLAVAAAPTIGSTNLPFVQITNKTQLAAYLALTTQAGLIGSDAAGYTGATVKSQLAEVKAIADAGIALTKRTVTVAHGDLTGASQAVNVGAVLPANAVVLAHELAVTEQFVGEADTTITLGGTDADAIVASTDLDALAIGKYSGTLGVHPAGKFSAEQLVATFAATALEDLTAGSVTITVWYVVLA